MMAADKRFDESISNWFEQTAPPRLPERVLEVTFERTRRSRQQVGWRSVLGRLHVAQSVAVLGGAAAVLTVATALALDFYVNQPAVVGPADDPRSSFGGIWVSTTDADGGTQTMTIQATGDGAVEIVVHDDVASVCSGVPSTMTGTGRIEGSTQLIIPSPVYTCDDGSEPQALSGPPLHEQLRNLTFVYDPRTDVLRDNFGAVWERVRDEVPSPEPTTPPSEPTTPPSEAEVTELLNGFLEAQIAGEGAQQYLHSLYPEIPSEDIPLLYATSAGAPYERAEFERVLGIEWPYGFIAFKVRLFAGDTVVEQLFFMPHDDPEYFPVDGRLGLEYQPDGFGTDIAPTTEDGLPVAMPYKYFDGEVILHAAHPWIFSDGSIGRLIPEGPSVRPTTAAGERNDWDTLALMADPALLGADCQTGPSPADAAALAESIRSFPDLAATAPVAVRAGATEGLVMDVLITAGTSVCEVGVLSLVFDQDKPAYTPNALTTPSTGQATGEWMRLYLFDAPEGSSMRILAVGIIAPESRFERAVDAASPVIDSVEIHAP